MLPADAGKQDEPPARRRKIRLPVLIASNVFALALMFSCCNPSTPALHANVGLCAEDPETALCTPGGTSTGDFRPVNQQQTLMLQAKDKDGKPFANKQVTITIAGANARTATVTTDAGGQATYQYTGTNAGTDAVTAKLPNGTATLISGAAVIHWLTPRHVRHPIVFVHGISEDAADFNVQLHPTTFTDNTQADGTGNEVGERDWSALLEGLTTAYDPGYIEAFCYLDDKAWNVPAGSDPGCPDGNMQNCAAATSSAPTSTCVSESDVTDNAIQLAQVVKDLSARAGGQKVTVIAYSMGSAILRSLLGGCLASAPPPYSAPPEVPACQAATSMVDRVFFLNGAQQGSWLLTVRKGYDATTLAGQNIPVIGNSPFVSALPLIEQWIFGKVKDAAGLDLIQPAITDLTPRSDNIQGHDAATLPASIQYYTFYGNDRLDFSVTLLFYTLPGKKALPLGDLIMLAQDDRSTYAPLWGGAALCEGCGPLTGSPGTNYYHDNTATARPGVDPIYREWELRDDHDVNINVIVPLLSGSQDVAALGDFVNSPVWHLGIGQPGTQSPGTRWQVNDVTGRAGGGSTDMPFEIISVLLQADGLSA
jgi:pimeloyl-ACP methyl ester carboxylesterase